MKKIPVKLACKNKNQIPSRSKETVLPLYICWTILLKHCTQVWHLHFKEDMKIPQLKDSHKKIQRLGNNFYIVKFKAHIQLLKEKVER